jgi:hypothetical protein
LLPAAASSVKANVRWITVSPAQGGAGQTVTMTVAANPGGSRAGYIVIRLAQGGSRIIKITQR